MASRRARTRAARRDRRKAKASDWRRSGTTNPKKVGHHTYDGRAGGRVRVKRYKKPPEDYRVVCDDGPAVTNLGRLLR